MSIDDLKLTLGDLLDLPRMQELFDALYESARIPSAIIDVQGKILTACGWQDACTQFHRKNPETEKLCIESDTRLGRDVELTREFIIYPCPQGMIDSVSPIVIEGHHLGNIFTGQLFFEKPDLEIYRARARKFGFDEEAYLAAIEKVPIVSRSTMENHQKYLLFLTKMMAESGAAKLREQWKNAQLSMASRQYNGILSTTADGFWQLSENGRLTVVNNVYCKMSGYSKDELIGKPISELDCLETPQEIRNHIDLIRQKGFDRFETRHRRKNGEIYDVEVSVTCIPENKERLVFLRDISERKQHEAEIFRVNRLYTVLSHVSQAMVRSETQDAFLEKVTEGIVSDGGFHLCWVGRVNRETHQVEVLNISGPGAGYARGLLIYSDDRPEGRGPTGRCIRENLAYICNDFFQDSCTIPWQDRAAKHGIKGSAAFPIEGEGAFWGALTFYAAEVGFFGEKEIGLLNEVAREIGFAIGMFASRELRKKAEIALQENERRLTEAERIAHVGYWERNLETGEYKFSDESYRILGLERQSRPFNFSRVSEVIHPDDVATFLDANRKAVEMGTTYKVDVRIRMPGGSMRFVESHGVREVDAHGKPLRMVGILQDITDRKQGEEEREKLREQLLHSQKLESIGRLAGGVAHDFNNMLSVILGYTELIQDALEPDNPFQAKLKEIQKAADRSTDLTRQLLAFARKQTISPKILDLNAVIESLLNMLRRLIGEDIQLQWHPGPGLGKVKLDPSQIDQLLANLVVNARDAIRGSGTVTLETSNMEIDDYFAFRHFEGAPGSYVQLTVSDSGAGMTKEVQDHLFEPFFTTKGMGKGTGLGLAIVYGIVKQNNGMINVYSEPGTGTTFKIYFQRIAGTQAAGPKPVVEGPTQGRGEVVLIVEDEESILLLGEMMLRNLGYEVLIAQTPQQAVEQVKKAQNKVHLLLTDVIMPEMNGRQLFGRLQTEIPGLKCLFMSGYTSEVIAPYGVLDPEVCFLTKPFSLKTLSEKVRDALAKPA